LGPVGCREAKSLLREKEKGIKGKKKKEKRRRERSQAKTLLKERGLLKEVEESVERKRRIIFKFKRTREFFAVCFRAHRL
jgi:hypothetical protein